MNTAFSVVSKLLLLVVLGVAGPIPGLPALAGDGADTDTSAGLMTSGIQRTLEPVIIKGIDLPSFIGVPVNHLFVYAYRNGAWIQVPAQVDEMTSEGKYVSLEDGRWDANDELVFMAQDLGDQAVGTVPTADGQPISVFWYEIEVTDPLDPAKKGWAYAVSSSTLNRSFTADYVSFNPFLHRISGLTYHLGFATPRPWIDYLTLGGSTVNVLDRTKTRLYCTIPLLCPITEAKSPRLEDDLIKDGPVRLIVRAGRVVAYGSMASWLTTLEIPTSLAGDMRFSTDFNAAVTGATYYNAVVPDGVTVDGVPDDVPETPLSPWWQLSTAMGTVIQVSDTGPIGGAQTNYYVDDATIDNSDTGDRRRYGDTGIHIANPNLSFSYRFTIYFLPGSQPNLGETYAAYFSQPLSAVAQLQHLDLPIKVYLPTIVR